LLKLGILLNVDKELLEVI